MLQGNFNKEQAQAFLAPLLDIQRVGIDKILLEINSDKTLNIGTQTGNGSNFVIVNYKANLFDGFATLSEKFQFGIHNLMEFSGIVKIFEEGFSLKLTEELAAIDNGSNKFLFYGCAAKDTLRAPGSKINGLVSKPDATFTWNNDLKQFLNAMALLKQEHIIFTGDVQTKTVTVAVTNKEFKRYNTFKVTVPAKTIEKEFRIVVDKDKLQPVVNSKNGSFDVSLLEKGVVLLNKTDYYDILHSVTPLIR
jgi:hypothetical protein